MHFFFELGSNSPSCSCFCSLCSQMMNPPMLSVLFINYLILNRRSSTCIGGHVIIVVFFLLCLFTKE